MNLKNARDQIVNIDEKNELIALRKRCAELEQKLHELSTKDFIYTQLVNRGNDGIVIIDNGIVRFLNKKVTRMSGYETDEILGHHFAEFVAEDQRDAIIRHYEQRMAGAAVPTQYETVLLAKDGTRLFVELNASVIRYQGRLADMAIIRDIAARKRAENDLKETLSKIEQLHEVALKLERCATRKEIFKLTYNTLRKLLHIELSGMKFADEKTLILNVQTPCTEKETILHIDIEKGALSTLDEMIDPGFPQKDIRLFALLMGHIQAALHRIHFQEKLLHQALHDSLTQVYNRYYLMQFLENERKRAQRFKRCIGFLMIDIDRFKEINDRFGHHIGDQILIITAQTIQDSTRECDVVVRYGGDEFLVVLPETDHQSEIVKERISRKIAEREDLKNILDFPLTISVGIAVWKPGESDTINDILSLADKRMYREKETRV